MRVVRRSLLTLLALLVLAPPMLAQERGGRAERSPQTRPENRSQDSAPPSGPGVLRLLPSDATSDKEITVGDRTIAYSATAGTLPLFDHSGERIAAVFYTAYVAKGGDAARRPVTFVFNGGPGAASAYLNLGAVGPRVVEFGASGTDGAAAKLADNPDSWLAFTDLVLIDPIGTGWSRTAKPDGENSFWGVRADADVIAKTIALYVAKSSRAASPKYLLGESYGGFRAAKVARALQNDQGIIVTGIVMASPLLETAFLWGSGQYALGAALNFPSLVAAELERTGRFTAPALEQAERFAMTEYLTTLAGAPPTGEQAKAFHARVAGLTGLPVDVVARTRGFVRNAYLAQLRAHGQTSSLYDATIAVPDPYPENLNWRGADPVLDGFSRALAGAFVGYARDELGFKTDMTYHLLASEVAGKWQWGDRREQPGVSDDLRNLLSINPSFRLLVAHGRTDLVTPYGVSKYGLDHLPDMGTKDSGEAERTQLKVYRGGHMFYFHREARRAFAADAKAFYQGTP
jgi:carboxypeptidase C (cathepsin A)